MTKEYKCPSYESWYDLCLISKVKCHPSGTCCAFCEVEARCTSDKKCTIMHEDKKGGNE